MQRGTEMTHETGSLKTFNEWMTNYWQWAHPIMAILKEAKTQISQFQMKFVCKSHSCVICD